MHRRKLPIGIQTFAKIREDDHYYVDKTGYIRQLVEDGTIISCRARAASVNRCCWPQGRALQQIKDRGTADKHRAAGQPIHPSGIEFSRERRCVVGFEVETL